MSRDITRPPHRGAIRIYGWELLAVCHHPDKFGHHMHCNSGDMYLLCHVTSQDHIIGGSSDLMDESPHGKLSTCHCGGRDFFNLLLDLTRPRGKKACDFIPLKVSHNPAKFVNMGTGVVVI